MEKRNIAKCKMILTIGFTILINIYILSLYGDSRSATVPQGTPGNTIRVKIESPYETTRIIHESKNIPERFLQIKVNFKKDIEKLSEPQINDGGTVWKTKKPEHNIGKGELSFEGIQLANEKGDFFPTVGGKVIRSVKVGRASCKVDWNYIVTGKHTILCTYPTVDTNYKIAWTPSSKIQDIYNNCRKDSVLFTITTPINGKRISDLLNDMDKTAPTYPPYPDESIDLNKKAVGMFTGGYWAAEKSEKIEQVCPICKSKNSITEHYILDIDFSCEISLPQWTNLKSSSSDAQDEWSKFIAALLEHEEAHLSDFKTQFMDKIFPLKHIVQACFECDKKGYNNLMKNKSRIRRELFNTYIKYINEISRAEQTFTKRVENEFPGYAMNPNFPLSP